jgi:hypothetical protein
MHSSWIIGAVENLERELQYYREVAKEQEAIIKQLHRGYALPGEVTYIHPADFMEIVNNLDARHLDIYSDPDSHKNGVHVVLGIPYAQSPYMPQITKNIK